MRHALGLHGGPSPQPLQQRPDQARPRHRFVQDGEVPVVMLSGPRPPDGNPGGRVAAAQAALDKERAARANAERLLAEAQAMVQSLQTKLAHADLAHREAVAAERRVREGLDAALRDAVAARELAEQRLRDLEATRAAEPPPAARTPAKRAPAAKPRTPAADEAEPEPVQWWLPSYKAKAKRR